MPDKEGLHRKSKRRAKTATHVAGLSAVPSAIVFRIARLGTIHQNAVYPQMTQSIVC